MRADTAAIATGWAWRRLVLAINYSVMARFMRAIHPDADPQLKRLAPWAGSPGRAGR